MNLPTRAERGQALVLADAILGAQENGTHILRAVMRVMTMWNTPDVNSQGIDAAFLLLAMTLRFYIGTDDRDLIASEKQKEDK